MSSIVETLQQGLDHHRAGRLLEAEKMYRRVLKTHPRHAGAMHLLGLIAYQVGKPEDACQYLQQAIRLDAFQPYFPADLGEVYRSLNKIPEAIAAYRQALELNPLMSDAQVNLGTLLHTHGDPDAAILCYREALRLKPDDATAYRNLASALQLQGHLTDAQAAYERSAQLAPDHPETYLHWGVCLQELGDTLNAIACYQKALRLNPEMAEAHYHCALARLTAGNYSHGWSELEWRLACPQLLRRGYPQPIWNGAHLNGRSILVHGELTLRDTLQFIRYVPLIAQRGGQIVLDVPEALIPLFEQSGVASVPLFAGFVRDGQPAPACDVQAPLMSLPRIFGTTLETVPAEIPYLKARPELVAAWRARIEELETRPGSARLPGRRGPRVAIAWNGSPSHGARRFRSISLDQFEPLARIPGVTLISLQTATDLDPAPASDSPFALTDFSGELDRQTGTFMDTAAIIANVDLVVTADTAIAHLAGALGANVWVALSTAADWRWMQHHDDSPWYPSMRLFRQTTLGDWASVFGPMATALTHMAAEAGSRK